MIEPCMARTGQANPPCPTTPQRYHRCRLPSPHPGKAYDPHQCRCGNEWICVVGSFDDLIDMVDIVRRGRGEAQEQPGTACI